MAEIDKKSGSGKKEITSRSQVGVLSGNTPFIYAKTDSIGYELAGSAALFRGDLKLMRNSPPFGDRTWKLYNNKKDPVERYDLSKEQPEKFKNMIKAYQQYA